MSEPVGWQHDHERQELVFQVPPGGMAFAPVEGERWPDHDCRPPMNYERHDIMWPCECGREWKLYGTGPCGIDSTSPPPAV